MARGQPLDLHTDRPVGMLWSVPRVYTSSRETILRGAERVLREKGPLGLSVDAVIRAAGVSKGGFFHHFPTKHSLLAALAARLGSAVDDRLGAPFDATRALALLLDRKAAVRRLLRGYALARLALLLESPPEAARLPHASSGAAIVAELALTGLLIRDALGTFAVDARRGGALRRAFLQLTRQR